MQKSFMPYEKRATVASPIATISILITDICVNFQGSGRFVILHTWDANSALFANAEQR